MLLIIGYGNPLRSDDAVGQHVTWAVAERLPPGKVLVVTAHQLTPELAEGISHADIVVFVDAREGDRPGEIYTEPVTPTPGSGAFTHHTNPASLLAASRDLFGTAPRGVLISIVGQSFEFGTELSPHLNAQLGVITEQVLRLIQQVREEQEDG